jgi:hypothetical protein
VINQADRILLGFDLKAAADELAARHKGDPEVAAVVRGMLFASDLVTGSAHNEAAQRCSCGRCGKPAP